MTVVVVNVDVCSVVDVCVEKTVDGKAVTIDRLNVPVASID
jgi:hypothetical protein